MRKALIFIIFTLVWLLMMGVGFGQKIPLKKHIPSASLILASGALEGIRDYLQFHYNGNNTWLNPKLSWVRKYRHNDPSQGEKFPGSTTIFVGFTDGWHLSKLLGNASLMTGIALHIPLFQKRNWKHYVLEALSYWAINRIGFASTYYTLNLK